MSLHSNPNQSAEIGSLVEALAKAQLEIQPPVRNRTVSVETRAGGNYTFKYATLDAVIEAVRAPLAKNGLWFTQIVMQDSNGNYVLMTRLLHTSNQWLSMTTPLIVGGSQGNQDFGSALTFMRRYALCALLGVAADEDDDANAADGNTVQKVQDRAPRSPKPDVVKDKPSIKVERPYTIPLDYAADGTANWMAWCQAFAAGIKGAASMAELQEWEHVNDDNIRQLQEQAPKAFSRLSLTVDEVRVKFGGNK